jgi:hypothetical protein
MTAQEQAYINGFVKRAGEYGLSRGEAIELFKSASPETLAMSPGARTAAQAAGNPLKKVAPAPPDGVSAASAADTKKYKLPSTPSSTAPNYGEANDRKMQPGQRAYNQ